MRNIILFLFLAIPLLIVIHFSLNTSSDQIDTIRIGINHWPGYEYLFIAKKEGFFKEAGLNIELVELSSLTEVRRAFEREKIDGMAATVVEVLEAYKNSERVAQIALVTDYSDGADVILSSPNINSIKDLKGKKIGVETGSLSLYMIYRALYLNSLKPSDVMLVPIELHDMASSLKSGKVDAITSSPPASITVKKLINANQVFDSSEIPGEILGIVAIDKNILAQFPELQEKLHKVWAQTLQFAKTNPKKAYETLVERFPISVNEFKKSMEYVSLISDNEQIQFLQPNGKAIESLKIVGNFMFMNSNQKIDYPEFIYSKSVN